MNSETQPVDTKAIEFILMEVALKTRIQMLFDIYPKRLRDLIVYRAADLFDTQEVVGQRLKRLSGVLFAAVLHAAWEQAQFPDQEQVSVPLEVLVATLPPDEASEVRELFKFFNLQHKQVCRKLNHEAEKARVKPTECIIALLVWVPVVIADNFDKAIESAKKPSDEVRPWDWVPSSEG